MSPFCSAASRFSFPADILLFKNWSSNAKGMSWNIQGLYFYIYKKKKIIVICTEDLIFVLTFKVCMSDMDPTS